MWQGQILFLTKKANDKVPFNLLKEIAFLINLILVNCARLTT